MRPNRTSANENTVVRTIDDINTFVKDLYDNVARRFQPTVVVGVARGGAAIASWVSYYFDIPIILTDYTSPAGGGENPTDEIEFIRSVDNKARFLQNNGSISPTRSRVLIVDEIADTGRTLYDLKRYFNYYGVSTFTAAMDVRRCTQFKPDYYQFVLDDDKSIRYPWNI